MTCERCKQLQRKVEMLEKIISINNVAIKNALNILNKHNSSEQTITGEDNE